MSKAFPPRRLDVAVFSREQGQLAGQDLLQEYERLSKDLRRSGPENVLNWSAAGMQRRAADGSTRPALRLTLDTVLPLTCQRCLGEVPTPLAIDRHFVFVPDEATAAALDDASEEHDVLELRPDFDLHALIEDELLMALPLVPRHDVCPTPVQLSAQDAGFDAADPARTHPFAALAALKKNTDDDALH